MSYGLRVVSFLGNTRPGDFGGCPECGAPLVSQDSDGIFDCAQGHKVKF